MLTTTPGEREAIELMARFHTTDLDEAVAREAGVRGFSKDEIFQSVIDEERSKLMGGKIPEGTCMEEGCSKPRREGKARCDEHQKALQNATYQRTKGKAVVKAAHHKEAKEPVIAKITDIDGSVYEAEIKNPPPIVDMSEAELPVGPDACVFAAVPMPMTAYELNAVCRMVQGMGAETICGFITGYRAGRVA